MTFWEQLGLEDPKRPEEPEFELVKRRKRGKKSFEGAVNESGLRFGPDVPVETVAIDNPEAAGIPESERELVGEKVVHRLAQTACTFRIIRYVARTWKRRDTGELVAAAPPPAVLDRSCADISFLAGMMVDKFCWHLPLHRQHQRLEAAGIRISRSSLTNWMLRSASLLTPICDAQFRSILESKAVAMDETPIRAGRVGPGKMRTAWFWPVFGDRDEIAFPFRLSRENGAVPDLLGDFKGTPLSDGNQAYAAYAESRNGAVRHAGCWSHARREFEKAKDSEPGLAAEALELIGGLFLCERKIRKRKLKGREKLEFRRNRALPVAEAFWKWCGRHYEDPRHLPKSPIVKALNYVLNRRAQLEVWLSDPRRPDRHQPSGARPAGPAARQEELALLLDGGRGGSRRDRPEPDRHVPASGRRPSSLPGRRAPANLRPSLEPRRGAHAEKMEGSVRRRSDDLGPRNRSPVPRFRTARRKLNPAKSDKVPTS